MERQPGAAVILAVVEADQQNLIPLLFREVVPAMFRLELDPRGFTADVLVDEIAGDQIVVPPRRGVWA